MQCVKSYFLYRKRSYITTKKVYNNIMNSIKLENRMDTIFMSSGNSKTSDPQKLLLNLRSCFMKS